MERPDFDNSKAYEELISEKAKEIRSLCIQEGIPCFMAFGLTRKKDENGVPLEKPKRGRKRVVKPNEYDLEVSYAIKDEAADISTIGDDVTKNAPYNIACVQAIPELLTRCQYDRRFSDFINIVNGFRAIPRSEHLSSDLEEEVIQLPDIQFQEQLVRDTESYAEEMEDEE